MFCTPKLAKEFTTHTIKAGLVPFLQSSPGIGKSSIVREIAEEFNLQLIDVRLAQVDPTELNGFPAIRGNKAEYVPMSIFPIVGDVLPKDKDGWLLFLDEMSSCPPAVQAAAYKVVLDRMVGQNYLHKNVAIVAAGNLITDNAVVTPISTALQSRVVHIKLEASLDDFKEWAYNNKVDHRVISFLNFKKNLLHSFNPDHDEATFPSPRTWEFLSKIIKPFPTEIPFNYLALMQGVVGESAAIEFNAYTQIYADLVTLQEIEDSPATCRVPSEPSTYWALIGSLVQEATVTNLNAIMVFIARAPIEFQVIFVKDLIKKDRNLVNSDPSIQKWILTNSVRFA